MSNQTNPIQKMMEEYRAYFYESTSVGSTRKIKSCDVCGSSIPKGTAHKGAKIFNDGYMQVDFCPNCSKTHANEISEMSSGKYDCYD